jgi:hypothetical protein
MKRLILSLALLLGLAGGFALAVPATSQAAGVFSGACSDADAKGSAFCADANKTSNPISGKNGILYKVTRIISIIAAITAVIMMIVGGMMYITSGGDTGKADSARHTILYAAVGLVVVGVAQGIVALIVNTVSK